jgi:cell wall assembly regulator SMI1
MTTRPPNAPARAKTANRPIEILRDGALKATIWENEGENGMLYSTTLARTYHANDGSLKDSHSFSGSELLRIAELARQAYAAVNVLRRDHAPEPEPQHEESLTDAYRHAL